MDNKANLVLTGCSGFLGRYIASSLAGAYNIIGIDKNIPHPSTGLILSQFRQGLVEDVVADIVKTSRPTHIVHLAGPASVPFSFSDPYKDLMGLLPGTVRICESLRDEDSNIALILISSAAVYGSPVQLPITESTSCSPISPYGIHKLAAEDICRSYSKLYGFSLRVLRVFSAYGIGLKKQLFWDIACKVKAARVTGCKYIELYGSGAETRDFISCLDISRAAKLVCENSAFTSGSVINVASGQARTIESVAKPFVSRLANDIEVKFRLDERKGDPNVWEVDTCLLQALGFEIISDFDHDIARLAEWLSLEHGL